METTMQMILELMYCLVALAASGFFVALIYTDLKKDQRDEEIARHREEREAEYHRKQMESFRK
ncbi:hypothetical protein LIQ46_05440 [Megasphaera elsdenii]|jgi:mannose/fructose/N-acetylgalactosamine-specific phosphotransferase system component IIC|uniref:Uncharacterized protein n=1 Tax=Megasphaera hominis TaxID=159836 RepID=A0ABR6VFB7_9FIRM|nr:MULTISPECIES: hypothetical protein [Megasphaera]MBC3535763.1 hypothetical protein [Megasphaera hominis]MCB5702400.1 hypothetical protein [Megasphaera elsdenii]MCB5727183.1 hypothetical protein [Megasphaera elsdenii]MCB5770963.1 hypothetical protein [Megasphaera elsdenii]RHA11440.1 hypothetical protein DW949_08755 [Megasphaera sp. AM44-1BH]